MTVIFVDTGLDDGLVPWTMTSPQSGFLAVVTRPFVFSTPSFEDTPGEIPHPSPLVFWVHDDKTSVVPAKVVTND